MLQAVLHLEVEGRIKWENAGGSSSKPERHSRTRKKKHEDVLRH
jgi:hypothetical protein